LGATSADGGTRSRTVTVGGETTLPFLHFEGTIPNPPVVAIEIMDCYPKDWSPLLLDSWGDLLNNPAAWAAKAEEYGADLIALKLQSASTEWGDTGRAEATAVVKEVLSATGLPLVIYGPGQAEKDNEVLEAAAAAAQGERVALGNCEDKNYRSIVAAALAYDHLVILINDMRMELDRILMDPTTGALGYGLEYSYSVMERLRIAALTGDSMTQQPAIHRIGEEAWRAKESKVNEGVPEEWGDWKKRSLLWEAITAETLLQAGSDIMVLRHPESIVNVKRAISKLMQGSPEGE